MKICHKCRQKKSLKEFNKNKNLKDGLDSICKICRNKANRKSTLKLHLDKTPEQYQELFDAQKGCCAICGKHQSNFKKSLAIDHNHKTGIIRGLLCTRCNLMLEHYETKKKQIEKYLQTVPQRMIKFYRRWLEATK